MELKVWVEGRQRVVCGANIQTTCQDVVVALATAMGQTGRFTLIEKWRDIERPLTPCECPLQSLHKWGEYAGEVRFHLIQADMDKKSTNKNGPKKDSKHRMSNYTHNFSPTTLKQDQYNISEPIKRSSTFSGAHYPSLPLPAKRRQKQLVSNLSSHSHDSNQKMNQQRTDRSYHQHVRHRQQASPDESKASRRLSAPVGDYYLLSSSSEYSQQELAHRDLPKPTERIPNVHKANVHDASSVPSYQHSPTSSMFFHPGASGPLLKPSHTPHSQPIPVPRQRHNISDDNPYENDNSWNSQNISSFLSSGKENRTPNISYSRYDPLATPKESLGNRLVNNLPPKQSQFISDPSPSVRSLPSKPIYQTNLNFFENTSDYNVKENQNNRFSSHLQDIETKTTNPLPDSGMNFLRQNADGGNKVHFVDSELGNRLGGDRSHERYSHPNVEKSSLNNSPRTFETYEDVTTGTCLKDNNTTTKPHELAFPHPSPSVLSKSPSPKASSLFNSRNSAFTEVSPRNSRQGSSSSPSMAPISHGPDLHTFQTTSNFDHSRQDSIEIEEYDLDQSFPDVVGRPHSSSAGHRTRARLPLEYRIEDSGIVPVNVAAPAEPETVRLLRTVRMQLEKIKVQEAQINDISSELEVLEETESQFMSDLQTIGSEIIDLEQEEDRGKQEVQDLHEGDSSLLLERGKQQDAELRKQISVMREKIENLENKLVLLQDTEKKTVNDLEVVASEVKERELKYLKECEKVQSDVESTKASLQKVNSVIEASELKLRDVNLHLESTENILKKQEEEALTLEIELREKDVTSVNTKLQDDEPLAKSSVSVVVSVPPEDESIGQRTSSPNTLSPSTALLSHSSEPGEAIIKILEGRLSPNTGAIQAENNNLGLNSFASAHSGKNPDGVWV